MLPSQYAQSTINNKIERYFVNLLFRDIVVCVQFDSQLTPTDFQNVAFSNILSILSMVMLFRDCTN